MKRLLPMAAAVGFVLTLCWSPFLRCGEAPYPSANSSASQVPSGPEIQYKSIDSYLNAFIPPFLASIPGGGGVSLAVGTMLNHRPGEFFFGETAKGNGKAPDGSSIFLTGSVSKTFTAALLALYVQQHLVNLDDPIQNYLPMGITAPLFNNDSSHPITLEHLATHTSGFPLMPIFSEYVSPATAQKLFNSLSLAQLGSLPGMKFVYSNYGYALLGQILARVGKGDFRQLVGQNITSPLAMASTKVAADLTASDLALKVPGNNVVVADWTFFPSENPAGGLYSSLDDMMKYLSYVMGEVYNYSLSPLLAELFQARHASGPGGAQIGLGWNLGLLSGSGEPLTWKDGGLLGYESFIGFVPSRGVGVVLLLNSQGVDLDSLGMQILNFLLTNPTQEIGPVPKKQIDAVTTPQVPVGGPVEKY